MNARFLATFCAVARFGSLNAAARHLGLSSASAGEQIKALEKDLNARLVSRHGRGIALTEAGHAVLPLATLPQRSISRLNRSVPLGVPSAFAETRNSKQWRSRPATAWH